MPLSKFPNRTKRLVALQLCIFEFSCFQKWTWTLTCHAMQNNTFCLFCTCALILLLISLSAVINGFKDWYSLTHSKLYLPHGYVLFLPTLRLTYIYLILSWLIMRSTYLVSFLYLSFVLIVLFLIESMSSHYARTISSGLFTFFYFSFIFVTSMFSNASHLQWYHVDGCLLHRQLYDLW